ncbi:MAG: VPLPA-CTERM sorting domain-containing protein [Gammaproteobacteria bacterium]|nr:VPLPA-CTERM sorting domain-containing protein [Gammaproteobacteria bacterium]
MASGAILMLIHPRYRNRNGRLKCMKLFKLLTASALAIFASTSMASTVLVPTSGSVDFELLIPPFSLEDPGLFIFDDEDTAFVGDSIFVPVTSPFDDVATVDIDTNFILAVCEDGGLCYGETFGEFLGDGSAIVQFGEGAVMVSGVAPVPVPAAVWLFDTGLLGLVAVARRRRTR